MSAAALLPTISVVVPVFNSEHSLTPLVERIKAVLASRASSFEILLVNDASRDGSWSVVENLARVHPEVRGISLLRNYGQHNALLCGIRAATGELTITVDDDLQHPPEGIPLLLAKLNEGFDVVYATPQTMPHALWRNLLSQATKRALAMAMGLKNVRDISAYRAFRTDIRRAFADFQSPNLLLDVLLSWGTTRFASVPVPHEPRSLGRSNYTFLKLFNQAMLILTGFSTAPLRLASLVGFGFTLFGVAVLGYVLFRYVFFGSVPGFSFLASVITLFSGAQLFALGIIGEYLARMFNRSMERPTYTIGVTTPTQPGLPHE